MLHHDWLKLIIFIAKDWIFDTFIGINLPHVTLLIKRAKIESIKSIKPLLGRAYKSPWISAFHLTPPDIFTLTKYNFLEFHYLIMHIITQS